jgi:hypothetical protein
MHWHRRWDAIGAARKGSFLIWDAIGAVCQGSFRIWVGGASLHQCALCPPQGVLRAIESRRH